VSSVVNSKIQAWLDSVRAVIHGIELEERQEAQRFNVFRVLGVERDEVRTHSRMLAALLDPSGTHAQGDRFLRSFLSHKKMIRALHTEAEGRWSVATEETHLPYGRFDIVIRSTNPKIVIVIENKVDAFERKDQCSDYSKWLGEITRNGDVRGALVYLTPDGREAKSMLERPDDYVRLGYDEISVCLEASFDATMPTHLRSVVQEYATLCREVKDPEGGKNSMTGNKELIDFLGQEENLDIAYRVASAMDELRESLLEKFFATVKKAIDDEFVGEPMNWKVGNKDLGPKHPYLTPKQANTDAFDAHEKKAKATVSLRAPFPFASNA
jgi:hypothetical protein